MARTTIARVMLTAAALTVPLSASAQPRGGAAATPPASQDSGDSMVISADEAASPTAPATPPAGDTGTQLQLTVPGGEVTAAHHPLNEEIYAAQQIYALRNRRFEINPSVNVALNDPFVSHTGFGLTMNYWISNVLSVGLTGVFFQGLNSVSEVNYNVGRSTRLAVPINEYQVAAALNFSYVPLYGKFSMFNRFIFHWDMYLTAGVGIMRSRPIPAIDPEVRTFDWNTAIMFDAGIGFRVFLSRSVAITLELRNFIYPELLENTRTNFRESGTVNGRVSTTCADCRRNPANWTSSNVLTDNVMLSAGLTFFLPFNFNYRLPK
jgi:outer membrane beta-barrel protein